MSEAPNDRPDLYAVLASQINHRFDARDRPQDVPIYDGAVYRRAYRGMEVPGLLTPLTIGDVVLTQLSGPLLTHRVDLRQRSGFPLIFDKSMERALEVGQGQWLTLCEITLDFPPDSSLPTSFQPQRERAEEAVGVLATLLDERVAQEAIAEDLILTDHGEPIAVQDIVENVRHYLPYAISDVERRAMAALPTTLSEQVELGLRWYLRGAQAGPGRDGVLFHWIAVEAVVGHDHPKAIEAALQEAGWDLAHQAMSVSEIAGVRGRIVHATESSKPLTEDVIQGAYYDLEAMSRILLRRELGIESSWPAPPNAQLFESPWDQMVRETWNHPPAIVWHEPPLPAIDGECLPGISWNRIHPPPEAQIEIQVSGGRSQEQRRLRRWVGLAATFFQARDPIKFEIRRLAEDSDAQINPERVVVASRFLAARDPVSELRLGLRVHVFLASHLMYRAGVPTANVYGRLLHGVLGGWARHRVFVVENEIDERVFTQTDLTNDSDLLIVGEHLGALAAGGAGGRRIIESWMSQVDLEQETVALIEHLRSLDLAVESGREMLDRLVSLYREFENEVADDD